MRSPFGRPAVIAAVAAIILSVPVVASGSGATPSPAPTMPPGTGRVSVRIDGLEGALGSRVAVILYAGVPLLAGGDTRLEGLGGLAATIDADPFSLTGVLHAGPAWGPGWLEIDHHPAAAVPPGIHTLVAWVSSDLNAYGEWTPALPIERACARMLTVTAGHETIVELGSQPLAWQTIPGMHLCIQASTIEPQEPPGS